MSFFKRQLPMIMVSVIGVLMIISYFSPVPFFQGMFTGANEWIQIIANFALVIGVFSLMRAHYIKIKRKEAGYGYSIVMYICLIIMAVAGLFLPHNIKSGGVFMWIFKWVNTPLTMTTFSLLAFYIASAAYRAFRARSFDATVMLVGALILMIGRVPLGAMLSDFIHEQVKVTQNIPGLPEMAGWLLSVPAMAARRAIFLGLAVGVVATSLRILFGIERTYMGGE
jgi:hypothetical protein